jgi:dolichol-phosphate mannosyltransferase
MPKENDFIIRGIEGVPDYEVRSYREKKNTTALLIPTLNEGTKLLRQLETLRPDELGVDVVIADGGSNDHVRENIERNNNNVHAFLTKQGEGALSAQLRMGFHFCLLKHYESVITMDGNNKDDPSGVTNIMFALNSGMDFVQGSRFIEGGQAINTPLLRYLAIRLIHSPLTSIGAKYFYTDTTNGFRGHSAKLLQHPQIEIFREKFDTYELLAYLPIRSRQVGLRVCEVPVVRRYPRGVVTPTKIRGVTAQYRLLRILFEAVIGRFNPGKSSKKPSS